VDGLEIFGRHDVLILNLQLVACLNVGDAVAAAADLCARTAVGAGVHLVQAQIAFARYSHAQSAVAEHFNLHQFAARAADVLRLYGIADGFDLVKI